MMPNEVPVYSFDASRPGTPFKAAIHELVAYRSLVFFLALRDLKVRFKQTRFGAVWSLLQPLLILALFFVFFGLVVRVPTDGVPYAAFAFAGLAIWTQSGQVVVGAANSLVGSHALLTKTYFPRLALPLSAAIASVPETLIAVVLLTLGATALGFLPTLRILFVPVWLLLSVGAAFGVGSLFASVAVRYRDAQLVLPFLMQLWLFATPIAYSSALVPSWLWPVYRLNPLCLAVQGLRWSVLATPLRYSVAEAASILAAVAALVIISAWLFHRASLLAADYV